MLSPSKHAHPDQTPVAAAAYILSVVRKQRVVEYDALFGRLDKRYGTADFLFLPAVSLLFLLGVLEYRGTVDSFEYTGQ